MTVLAKQTILRKYLLHPCIDEYRDEHGNSAGLSACGYDLTLAQDICLKPGEFMLASTEERFTLPDNIVGIIHDKSSLARRGLAVQNTVAEPGWRGYLTLELTNHNRRTLWHLLLGWLTPVDEWPGTICLNKGAAIAQVIFHALDEPTCAPYRGKYQDQEAGPQKARRVQSETSRGSLGLD